MEFIKIDIDTWSRKKSYNHFLNEVPCTYSMTVNLDITKLLSRVKNAGVKLFPTLLYGISTSVNSFPEFRMDFDKDGNLGYYSTCNPCYTVFHGETETFTEVWTEYSPDFHAFMKNYDSDMLKYRDDKDSSKPASRNNLFNVSCIPWASFSGFNLNIKNSYDYFPPIFTVGKYFTQGEKTLLPFAMQCHHAVCDGFHAARFVNHLQSFAESFTL